MPTYSEVFNALVGIIERNIHWYQGGADVALKALLEHPEELKLLIKWNELDYAT